MLSQIPKWNDEPKEVARNFGVPFQLSTEVARIGMPLAGGFLPSLNSPPSDNNI
jgi:hypothetical protein